MDTLTNWAGNYRYGAAFRGAVVALGELGVVTRLTLAVRQTYAVAQHVYEGLPLAELVRALLPALEARLAPFHARPHWGKLFTTPAAAFDVLYERLPDFRDLLRSHDPGGKFRNAFLDEHVFAAPATGPAARTSGRIA